MKNLITKFFEDREYETITELCQIMIKSDKSTILKWHNYTSLYNYLFKDIKNKKLNVFEVGIFDGAKSLFGWQEYFQNSNIYAADIDTKTFVESERIKCFFCDQRNPNIINNMWNSTELKDIEFDIIIDDGDHSFISNYTFFVNSIHKLKKGGYFIIEDLLQDNFNEFQKCIPKLKEKFNLDYIEVMNIPNPNNNIDNNVVVIKK
jgi:hypothetical protein